MSTELGLPSPNTIRKQIVTLMDRRNHLVRIIAEHGEDHRDGWRWAEANALAFALAEMEAAWRASVRIHRDLIWGVDRSLTPETIKPLPTAEERAAAHQAWLDERAAERL